MSEDVDFKVVLRDAAPASANQLRKELGRLRDRMTAGLQAAGFDIDPANTAQVKSRDANRYTVYHLTAGPTDSQPAPLRASLLIELNYTQLRLPTVRLPVASFITEAFARPAEIAGIDCASITETAAEKFVSLTRRTAMEMAGLSRVPDPSLVRHIYDLHQVREHIEHAELAALARTIAAQDAQEFAHQHPAYQHNIVAETHKAVAFLNNDPAVAARYDSFVAAMVYGDQSLFRDAMATVSAMAARVWP